MTNRILIIGIFFSICFIACNNLEVVIPVKEKVESKYCANYIKGWKVNPKGQENPYAYINDMTSTFFYYDNGIRQ